MKRGWIMTIGVLKPLRIKGIGTALMLHGLKFLKSKGMNEAELGVDDSNPTKAIELYKKVGFKVVKKDLTYLKAISQQNYRDCYRFQCYVPIFRVCQLNLQLVIQILFHRLQTV